MSRIKQFILDVVENLAVDYGLDVVRGYVLEKFEGLKPEDVAKAVEEWDTDLWGHIDEETKRKAVIWADRLKKYSDHLSVENVWRWITEESRLPEELEKEDLDEEEAKEKERRLRLRSIRGVILNHAKGQEWLRAVVEAFKDQLFPVPASASTLRLVPLTGPAAPVQEGEGQPQPPRGA